MHEDYFSPEVVLRKCLEFKDLNDKEISGLISIGQIEEYLAGDDVFSIDHKGRKFFIVLHGRLTLRLRSNVTKEYRSGELFGEVAIIGNTLRFGTIRATEASRLFSIDKDQLFNCDQISKELALKVIVSLSKKIVSYFSDEKWYSSLDLINKGECDYVEFKKSINDSNKENIVRTMASFMNLNGGTIFCGVEDKKGDLIGIDLNRISFDDIQKMMNVEIDKRIGSGFNHLIHYDIEEIEEKVIIRIDCNSSNSPVFFKKIKKGRELEYFVVRSGSENKEMQRTSEIINYVQKRFKRR